MSVHGKETDRLTAVVKVRIEEWNKVFRLSLFLSNKPELLKFTIIFLMYFLIGDHLSGCR